MNSTMKCLINSKIKLLIPTLILSFFITGSNSFGAELLTNSTHMQDAPKWLTSTRINKIADSIQQLLEWDIHRVEVHWVTDQTAFEKIHNLGPTVLAFSRKSENSIYLGPKVNSNNFDSVFGHELVHVISFQKYKESIPKWLEEGLANHLAKANKVDYKWLASKPLPKNIHDLTHPFDGDLEQIKYHYMASQALIEMIAARCDLRNLLRLSLGTKMDGYLETYCRINDLNIEYQKWLTTKSKAKSK